MSLMGAMNSAVSGLNAQTSALATVSNNLANSSTTAYKSSSTSFSSMVAGSGQSEYGGVSSSTVYNNSAQGLLVDSASPTNLAIEGDGYFIVSQAGDPASRYYTRNGEFSVDNEGYLTNGDSYLMGWETDADGNVTGGESSVNLTPVNVNEVQSSVEATTEVDIQANLPADAEIGSAYDSSFEVYDSLGTASTITATYTKTAENAWTITYSNPISADTLSETGTVTSAPVDLVFNEDGTLASMNPADPEIVIEDWTTGAADSTIDLGLGTIGDSDGLTQYSTNNEDVGVDVKSVQQNGLAYGDLNGVQVDTDGSVIASFTNGETRVIYKVPIATFNNPNGLTAGSDGLYSASSMSGNATLHTPGTGGTGLIASAHLEASNVDTSTEFSNMLAAQQAYSSATQVISTSSAMFDSLLSAVR